MTYSTISQRLLTRALAGMLVFVLAVFALANPGSIRLSSFPAIALADGRTQLTITAEVRNQNGSIVADGTQVVFNATLGTFQESVVQTVNGFAKGLLIASNVPGSSTVTASALQYTATSTMEVEFVADRSLLSSAREFVEVYASQYLTYSPEYQTVAAAAPNRGVKVRYKDIEVEADDIQLKVPTTELKARKAKVRIGRNEYEFETLYMKLNSRRGVGEAHYQADVATIVPGIPLFRIETIKADRIAAFDVSSNGMTKSVNPPAPNIYSFMDLSTVVTMISAKKLVARANHDIQFHKANLMVSGMSVLKLPLFQLSAQTTAPVVTDQFLNITNNQLAIDYPYYISLRPGETSLMRFRSGTRYGHGVGSAAGTFLDYELKWNHGDESEGGLTVAGLARNDWGLTARQYIRLDTKSTATALLDFPANRTLFGSFAINRQFKGFTSSFNTNLGRSIRGPKYENDFLSFNVDSDPMKVAKLPLKFNYGFDANQSTFKNTGGTRFQRGMGLRGQLRMVERRVGKTGSLGASFTVKDLVGHNVNKGLTLSGTGSYRTQLGTSTNLDLVYEFLNDNFNSKLVGQHRVSARTYTDLGNRLSLSLFGAKSLDIDRFNAYADCSYKLSNDWRLASTYLIDRYQGSKYDDFSLLVGYRIGFREVGLSWSTRTKRLGIELLGVRF